MANHLCFDCRTACNLSFGNLLFSTVSELFSNRYAVPLISYALFYILGWLIYLLNNGVRIVESLPFAVFDSIVISWYDAVFLYLFLTERGAPTPPFGYLKN